MGGPRAPISKPSLPENKPRLVTRSQKSDVGGSLLLWQIFQSHSWTLKVSLHSADLFLCILCFFFCFCAKDRFGQISSTSLFFYAFPSSLSLPGVVIWGGFI